MDRGGARAGALILAALAGGSFAAVRSADLPIREARWMAPEALYPALTREPPECLARPRDPARRRQVAVGRIAFRSPLLLGGQAARVGISCATCHRNGRSNPDFRFPGLSGAPGTADVTSFLMSSHRGDHEFNPKPIPDLGGPRARLNISRGDDGKLETFVHGLIVEEFDGAEPPPEILAALAAYVRALQPEACRGAGRRIGLRDRLAEVEDAVRLAEEERGEVRAFLLASARSLLGAIDERFALPGLERDRQALRAADADLRAIRADEASFAAWQRRWPARRRLLLGDGEKSLFAPRQLRRALEGAS